MKKLQYICQCELTVKYYPFFIFHSQAQRNPLRVAEAVHESSARIAKSYPATPIAFPGGERITPIIYVGGELAESNLFPLREIVRFAQGIALFKKRGSA